MLVKYCIERALDIQSRKCGRPSLDTYLFKVVDYAGNKAVCRSFREHTELLVSDNVERNREMGHPLR